MEHNEQRQRPEVFLDALLTQPTRVAGDLVELDEHIWAIHGTIPVDGEVILAEFDRQEDAQAVLDHLAPPT